MATVPGYRYSTSRHWEVLKTGRRLIEVMERWNPALCGEGNHAALPRFPQDIANQAILRQLAAMERLLNPVKHGWMPSGAPVLAHLWNDEVEVAYTWISRTFRSWIERWGLERLLDVEVARLDRQDITLEADCDEEPSIGTLTMPIEWVEVRAFMSALDTLGRELNEVGSSVSQLRLVEAGRQAEARILPANFVGGIARPDPAPSCKLKKCEVLAKQSYEYVIEQDPGLADEPFKRVYKWLVENDCPVYGDQELPGFETWDSHRRNAYRKLGLPPRNTPRAGRRVGRSIIPRNEV